MKQKRFFLKSSIPFALSFWLFDSTLHFLAYDEPEFELIPSDLDDYG